MALPYSDFLLTSFFKRSPIEMQAQLKYSARASAFSFLLLPGGPAKKMRLAIIGNTLDTFFQFEIPSVD